MDNNTEIIEFFKELIQDSLDIDAAYVLLNQADAQIRMKRPWEILKKLDQSLTRNSGDTYLTAKTLPSDYHRPLKMMVGTLQRPLKRLAFEKQNQYQFMAGMYLIDFRSGSYYITNGTWAGIIYHYYLYKPLRLAEEADASHLDAPVFPSDYYPYYAYVMAEIYMAGIDQDERSLASVPEWVKQQKVMWDAMVAWDAELKENDLYQQAYQDDGDVPLIDLGLL